MRRDDAPSAQLIFRAIALGDDESKEHLIYATGIGQHHALRGHAKRELDSSDAAERAGALDLLRYVGVPGFAPGSSPAGASFHTHLHAFFAGHTIELLAVLAYYHAGPESQRLDWGHTVSIGESWLPGSKLTHERISRPYAFGPSLERCEFEAGHIRVLAVQPITEAERDFKAAEGVEALERRFEDEPIAFTHPIRESVL